MQKQMGLARIARLGDCTGPGCIQVRGGKERSLTRHTEASIPAQAQEKEPGKAHRAVQQGVGREREQDLKAVI